MGLSACGGGEKDQQQRHADPVIEAAFDVQRLTHDLGKPVIGDDGTPESGVGWGKDDAKDQGIIEGERLEERDRP